MSTAHHTWGSRPGREKKHPHIDRDMAAALAHLDDDGAPQASAPRGGYRGGGRNAFTVRDRFAEPHRDDRELGGEA